MMDDPAREALQRLLSDQRVATIGTLDHAHSAPWPRVSMVPVAFDPSEGAFFILISGLAQHTRDIHRDPRVGLLLAEPDRPSRNPQTLARLSIQAVAEPIEPGDTQHDEARSIYLARFPSAEMTFSMADFRLYRLVPDQARFIAGFGSIHDLSGDQLKS